MKLRGGRNGKGWRVNRRALQARKGTEGERVKVWGSKIKVGEVEMLAEARRSASENVGGMIFWRWYPPLKRVGYFRSSLSGTSGAVVAKGIGKTKGLATP